jgi:uncharacterized protein
MKTTPLYYLMFAILGVFVGIFAGLFGVGGGIIMVPALVLIAGFSQQMAQGASLVAMIPTAITSAVRYYKEGNLTVATLLVALALCVGSVPGGWIGSGLAARLPQATLRSLFALFMVSVAAYMMPSGSVRSMSLLLGMTMVAVGVRLMFAR